MDILTDPFWVVSALIFLFLWATDNKVLAVGMAAILAYLTLTADGRASLCRSKYKPRDLSCYVEPKLNPLSRAETFKYVTDAIAKAGG